MEPESIQHQVDDQVPVQQVPLEFKRFPEVFQQHIQEFTPLIIGAHHNEGLQDKNRSKRVEGLALAAYFEQF